MMPNLVIHLKHRVVKHGANSDNSSLAEHAKFKNLVFSTNPWMSDEYKPDHSENSINVLTGRNH